MTMSAWDMTMQKYQINSYSANMVDNMKNPLNPLYTISLFLMWLIMMIAMMLPSAIPVVLMFDKISNERKKFNYKFVPTLNFTLSYLISSFLLIIDSIAGLFTNRSFLHCFTQRKHMIMLSLSLSGILCGFMWEFWNNWASPSWVYQIPIFEYFYVFEMPILGYLGYIPFAWTVFQYQSLMKLFVNKYIFKQPFIVFK